MSEPSPQPPATPQSEAFRPLPPRVSSDNALPAEFSSPAENIEPPVLPQPEPPAATARHNAGARKIRRMPFVVAAILAVAGLSWNYAVRSSAPEENMLATATHLVEQGDYAAAFPLLKQAAEADMPPAYIPLAECYTEGLGTEKSPQKAHIWYEKAEQEGDISATAALADADFEARNYAAAVKRYLKLGNAITADQAYRCACALLGLAEQTADADCRRQAYSYLHAAAKQGNAQAAIKLADAYYAGVDVEKSLEMAISWYRVAAEQGVAEAQFRLAWCLMLSSPAQNEMAVAHLAQAAKQGHSTAAYDLAVCYFSGRGVARDVSSAVYWLQQAAASGNPAALRRLAFCYRDAVGVQKNIAHAVQLFAQAAEAGDAEACYNYAWCLQRGFGVCKNPAAAVHFFFKAAAADFPPAQMALQELRFFRFLPNSAAKLLKKSQNYPKM